MAACGIPMAYFAGFLRIHRSHPFAGTTMNRVRHPLCLALATALLVTQPASSAPSAGPPSIYEEAGYFVRPMTRPPNA